MPILHLIQIVGEKIMINQLNSTPHQQLYDQDFYLWLETTTRLLRERKFEELDLENLIEEIASMGRSERRELRNRLRRIVEYLLKLKYWTAEKEQNQRGWRNMIIEQRSQVRDLLKDSPSLKPILRDIFVECYTEERLNTSLKTNLSLQEIPLDPPFTLEETLNLTGASHLCKSIRVNAKNK